MKAVSVLALRIFWLQHFAFILNQEKCCKFLFLTQNGSKGWIYPFALCSKVDKWIDWSRFSLLLDQAKIRKKLGPHGYDPLLLFQMPSARAMAQLKRSTAGRKPENSS